MDLVYFLYWWLGLLYVGLVSFFLFRSTFVSLSGQGYFLAKPLGLLLITYLAWIASSSPFISFHTLTIMVIAILLGLAAIWRYRQTKHLAIPWKSMITQEVIFTTTLALWSLIRAYNPRIEGVEKFMNIAFINAVLRTDHFPVMDPWYAGEPINYYYFGHTMIASLIKLTQVPSSFAFNLGVATVLAFTITVAAFFIFSLTKSAVAAAVAAWLAALSSNLDPAIQTLKQVKDYVFFSATRLDPHTINEFPLYSFIVADLHAHTLNLPITLTIVGLLYLAHQSVRLSKVLIALLALAIGATAPTNAFDALVYGGITGLVMLHRSYRLYGWNWIALRTGLIHTAIIGAGAVVLYAPFYLNFHQPTGGVGIDLFKTPFNHILINFGVMLAVALPILPQVIPSLRFLRVRALPVSQADLFMAVLLVGGLLAIVLTEFFYIKDIYHFENPPYARANTIFKIYYQVWIILSLVAGYGFYVAQKNKLRFNISDIYLVAAGVLLALSSLGTWQGLQSHANGKADQQQPWTLDGYAYLKTENSDQLALINWINANIHGHPVIAEASGDSYTQQSRISSYTGLSTPLGWASHEWGWRYTRTAWGDDIAPRVGFVEQIYTLDDPQALAVHLQHYDIRYIIASPVEQERYGLTDFNTIAALAGQPIFSQGDYAIYQVPAAK